jgi:hypothetical protein
MALGEITFTSELDPTSRWVVLTLTCEGMTEATINRLTPDGTQAVRGAFKKEAVNSLIAADYEAPQNTPISYYAVVSDGTQTRNSDLVTLSSEIDRGGDVVFGLTNPLAVQKVIVVSVPSLVSESRQDVVQVVGRRDAVVVSDVRSFPTGTLTLATLTDGERFGLYQLLNDGGLLAFSPHQPNYGFSDVWYLAVGNVTERRISPIGHAPERYFDLEFRRVAPPPADFVGPAFRTWGDLWSESVSWDSLKQAGITWLRLQVK